MSRSHIATDVSISALKSRRKKSLTGVDSIDGCKSDENCKIFPCPVDSVHAESGIVQYRREIFATVDEMRKYVLSIIVSTNALQCAPDSRQR